MKIEEESSIEINGNHYWSVAQFAKLTGRRDATIRRFVREGGEFRKLKATLFYDKPFIHLNELFEYPFSNPGAPNKKKAPYHYVLNDKGKLIVGKGPGKECFEE